MWEKYSLIKQTDLTKFEKMHDQKEQDWYNNQFHLSGYVGSVNDPNGLAFIDGKYYIFMQNCPFSIQHFNKSWALYTTTDFINYVYEGITLTPSCKYDINGVFSGSAKVNKAGEIELFYTGNIKLADNKRTATTIKALIDFKNKIVEKELLFETDLTKYSGHYRDPIIFEKNNQLYMLNGAQTIDEKAVLNVYKFDGKKWNNFKDIKFDENDEQNAYMLECPNYFVLENKTFIFACLEQNGSLKQNSHFVKYREVELDDQINITYKTKLEKIDLGYDFYAPQVFNNTKDQVIMLGWLGNSKSNPFPPELTTWSNQLTVPRKLFIKNNRLAQLPLKQLEALRIGEFKKDYQNGTIEILANKIEKQNFVISLSNENKEVISIIGKDNKLIIDRSKTTFTDEENLPAIIELDNLQVNDLQILVDRSVMEIFVNDGEHAISVRFYLKNHCKLSGDLSNIKTYQLKGYNYTWNNILYKNVLKGAQ